MSGICILLVAAAIAFGLAKLLRLPPIPLLMLIGAVLHEMAKFWRIEVPEALLGEMMEIGLAMLVFTAGVDLSPRRMLGRTRAIIIVATVQFLILGLAGVITAFALGYDLTIALYLGCALSASSTLVVVSHLQRRRQMFEPFGRLVLGVLLVQDLFIILIMVALLKSSDGLTESFFAVTRAVGLGCVAIGIHRWFVPWITRRLKLDDEELMLGALGILFVFSGLAYLLKLPFLVGAFFAGFSISAFPMNGLVRGMLGSLSSFFLALFFIGVGATLTLPQGDMLWHSLIFIIVLILVTVGLVSVVGEAVGYSTRASVEAGILLSQTSEFSLLLALTGMASGQISAELFSMITLITVSTMTLTPLISRDKVAWSLMKLHPRYRRGEQDCENLQGHAVMLGYGRAGRQTLQLFQEHDISVIVIDDDAAVIRKLIARGVRCIQGDGANPRILAQANCREAKAVVCSMRRTRDAKIALDYLRKYPTKVFIRTFEPEETAFVKSEGGYPIETARASAHTMIEWLDTNLSKK
ncbi:MAG: Kef-type K+ transport system membrane component KefB [Lentimonas sp.]|jgi:Kef-type K+ transport system membrane component KefB